MAGTQMSRRKFLALSATTGLSALLAACGGAAAPQASTEPTAAGAAAAPTAAPAAAEAPTSNAPPALSTDANVIDWWNGWGGQGGKALDEVAKTFNAENHGFTVVRTTVQDVPRALYDAAVVDGANKLQRFWHVTIPMCTPSILFVTLTGLIGAFQYFIQPWIMTQGGPLQQSEFYGVYLYRNAFMHFKMGYASALAWLLFIIIMLSTIALFRTSARWVYYAGEER